MKQSRRNGRRANSIILAAAFLAAACMAPPATGHAQQYIGIYAGAAIPLDGDTVPDDRFLSDLGSEASADGVSLGGINVQLGPAEYDIGPLVGGRIGYWFENLNSHWLGVEAELYGAFPKLSEQNMKTEITGTANGVNGGATLSVPVDEADLTVLTVGFNLLARYPNSWLQPYAGAGIGIFTGFLDDVKVREPVTINIGGNPFTLDAGDVFIKEDKHTAPALQLIGGVRGFLNDNLALFAEYKYVKTELEFQSVQVDYDASHIYGGVEFYFGPGVIRPAGQSLTKPPWPP